MVGFDTDPVFLKMTVKRSNQKSSVSESKLNPPISGIKFPFLGDLKAPTGDFKIKKATKIRQNLPLDSRF